MDANSCNKYNRTIIFDLVVFGCLDFFYLLLNFDFLCSAGKAPEMTLNFSAPQHPLHFASVKFYLNHRMSEPLKNVRGQLLFYLVLFLSSQTPFSSSSSSLFSFWPAFISPPFSYRRLHPSTYNFIFLSSPCCDLQIMLFDGSIIPTLTCVICSNVYFKNYGRLLFMRPKTSRSKFAFLLVFIKVLAEDQKI